MATTRSEAEHEVRGLQANNYFHISSLSPTIFCYNIGFWASLGRRIFLMGKGRGFLNILFGHPQSYYNCYNIQHQLQLPCHFLFSFVYILEVASASLVSTRMQRRGRDKGLQASRLDHNKRWCRHAPFYPAEGRGTFLLNKSGIAVRYRYGEKGEGRSPTFASLLFYIS